MITFRVKKKKRINKYYIHLSGRSSGTCSFSEVSIQPTSLKPDDGDIHPRPRLLLGQEPSEQLLSKQSMEVVKMDEELSNFQKNWQERFDAMLQRHQQEHDVHSSSPGVSEKP